MEQNHPATLKELLDVLEQVLSPEALDDLSNLKRNTLYRTNFGLGLYIRNHLIHQNDNKRALYEDCHRVNLVDPLHSEAHDVSQLAILRLWERLQD